MAQLPQQLKPFTAERLRLTTMEHAPLLHQGQSPLLISIPHLGTHIPDELLATMTPVARRLDDTDWHLDRLYDFAEEMNASVLKPVYSRYVIDLNRPPTDQNLYPGQNTTGLLPIDTFDEETLYVTDHLPNEAEKERRRHAYWQPYHQALKDEIARIKRQHGYVLLWEAHSIRAYIPRLFEGRLPDFNFGTANDHSALPGLAEELAQLAGKGPYNAVANGRFQGGYITRHYGQPDQHVHAIQLELTQLNYMDETPPYAYDTARAAQLAPVIKSCLTHALNRLADHYSSAT